MRFYHFLKEKYALESLTNRRLKLCTLDNANDEFEFLWVDFPNEFVRNAFEKLKLEYAKNVGFICLSDYGSLDFDEKKMWCEYADEHKGICFEIEIPDSYLKNNLMSRVEYRSVKHQCPTWVVYPLYMKSWPLTGTVCRIDQHNFQAWSLSRRVCEKMEQRDRLDFLNGVIATKSTDWKGEQECRLFFGLTEKCRDLFFMDFFDDFMIKGVTLGRESELCKNRLKDCLGDLKDVVPVYQMRLDDSLVRLRREEICL